MSYSIAIAGKGGTGKTTIAALLVRMLKEKRAGSILAVDADPNSTLAEALGIKAENTIGGIINEIAANPDKVPAGMTKDRFIEYQVQSAISEGDGFDLLTMGRPEGPGCYCYVNNVLRGVLEKLMREYAYVVMDNEAGFEHLARRTMRSSDALIVVSDALPAGLKAASRINGLVKELGIKNKKRFLVINRYRDSQKIVQERIKALRLDLDYIGNVPDDENIMQSSLDGGSVMSIAEDAPGFAALKKLGDKIL